MGLPSCFRVSDHFFFLLVERSDFEPLKICMTLCLSNQDETTEFSTTEYKQAKSTWLFWLVCCLDLYRSQRASPSLRKALAIPIIWLKLESLYMAYQTGSILLVQCSLSLHIYPHEIYLGLSWHKLWVCQRIIVPLSWIGKFGYGEPSHPHRKTSEYSRMVVGMNFKLFVTNTQCILYKVSTCDAFSPWYPLGFCSRCVCAHRHRQQYESFCSLYSITLYRWSSGLQRKCLWQAVLFTVIDAMRYKLRGSAKYLFFSSLIFFSLSANRMV